MIYLIGGPPKCGKTTLAKRLSKRLGIPWISGDTLQVVAREYMDKKDIDTRLPWSKIRKIKKSNDEAYSTYSAKEIVRFYTTQAKVSYRAIDMVSVCEIADGNDYIIEGYQVEPQLVNKIIKKYGKENFRVVFLIKSNVDKFVSDIKKSTTPNDWIIERTKDESTYHKIAKMISEYSRYFEKEAKKYKYDVFEMDDNFNKQISIIEKHIKS
jgi:2-phosphoglycerate kinase